MDIKKFQKRIENFICENCGRKIKGDGYTNHCSNCLWSKHVDINPGDRKEACRGLMKPIGINLKEGEYILIHCCLKCGKEMKNKVKIPPIHPGEILLEEFLRPVGITQYRLSKDINVPPRRINEIVHGKRAISANTALRLGRYFNMSPQFWMNLQSHYDIEVETDKISDKLDKEIQECSSLV